MYSTLLSSFSILVFALNVAAESHTIHFNNKCGFGVPTLVQAGQILSTGADYTKDGPINSAIAYLNTNSTTGVGMRCGLNGDDCLLIELNIANPPPGCIGCGPVADISLIPDHEFNVAGGFTFYGGDGSCNGEGAFCGGSECNTAFFDPNDNGVQRACQSDNANLMITFCGSQQTGFTAAVANSAVDLGSSGISPSSSIITIPTPTTSSSAVASSSSSIAVVPVKASSVVAVPSSGVAPVAVANPSPPLADNNTASAASSSSSSSGRCKRSLKRSKIEADISPGRLAHTRSRARARKF